MNWLDVILHVRHVIMCREEDTHIETAGCQMFMRCRRCGLRSPGVTMGPLNAKQRLSGKPAKHRLRLVKSA